MVAKPAYQIPSGSKVEDGSDLRPVQSERPVVLLVDDSRMQRRMLAASLTKWGYEVLEAKNGYEALELCATHPVSMVISDWMMPGMNGPDFCQAFRQMQQEEYGYFILLTSKGETSEITEGLESGADDFLTKPVSFSELRARIRAGERILKMQNALIQKNVEEREAKTRIEGLYNALNRDLDEARKFQQSLVQETDIKRERARISMMLQPSGQVGGDLVGQFPITEDQIGFYSLDVSGHGVASALLAARLAGYFSGSSPDQNIAIQRTSTGAVEAKDPAETVSYLNDLLLTELETDQYLTIALCVLDLKSGNLRLTQAGHPHPLLVKESGTTMLGRGGPPVGLLEGMEYETLETTLEDGDRIFLYSDGITECENAEGGQFGDDGLSDFVAFEYGSDGPEVLADLNMVLTQHIGGKDFQDDISAILLEFSKKPPSSEG